MSILLALAYHDRVSFEIFQQLELLHYQPLIFFFWLNMVDGSIRLVVPLRYVFCVKLQKDSCTVLVLCSNLVWGHFPLLRACSVGYRVHLDPHSTSP